MASKQKSIKMFSSGQSASIAPWLGIAAIIVLIDQITKITVNKMFTFGESVPVTSFFNLVLAYNKGAAFSFLANESGWQRYVFTGVAIAAVIFITYLLKRHAGQRLFCWALALILGGAVGNVIDRVLYGHVIDFLDFYIPNSSLPHWPAFNVADMAIVGGAILFVIDELRRVGK
ncbi:signal peptidase II [Herbaspirillum sp. GCM10030257]|uniref:signal peptidase II n=1 Tax=Herbaspirillum sp. GCM10030257 TaxID=3273393 RepID=UPI003611A180